MASWMDKFAGVVRDYPLFEGLSAEAVAEVLSKAEHMAYAQGEAIVWNGEPGEHLYVITSGIVAITSERPWTPDITAWAFFKPGECLGEVAVIQGGTRTATASAVIEVEALRIGREDVIALMHRHAVFSFNIARMIAHRLAQNAVRFKGLQRHSRLVAVVGVRTGVGASTISRALKYFLSESSDKSVGYAHCLVDEPDARAWDFPPVVMENLDERELEGLPMVVRVGSMIERFRAAFDVAVVSFSAEVDRALTAPIIERADELVMVTDGDLRPEDLTEVRAWASGISQVGLTAMCTVLNQVEDGEGEADPRAKEEFDFVVGHLPGLKRGPLPEPARETFGAMGSSIRDRMGKPHSVGLYIPTTIDVDQDFDAQPYVDRACGFLGECFGGATVSKSRGVWRSEDKGLVGEDIYVVRSHCADDRLNAHVPAITTFMKRLKTELAQEAMAMEIDGRLIIL